MVRRSLVVILLAIACATSIVAPAGAATWGGEVFGAFNTYNMQDWNDLIDVANQNGASAENINNGFGGGLGVRIYPNSQWMFGATWEPMFASTKDDISNDEISLQGNSFQATVGYIFPSTSKTRFGIGAGPGLYMLSGEATDGAGGPSVELKGSTVGFHFMGMGEWEVSPGFALTGSAGYRIANISDTEFDGQSASPKFETDYSGVILRAGMVFSMPSSK